MDTFAMFDVIIAVCFIAYGYKWLMKTPEFKSQQGFGTKRTKQSPEAWKYGHKVAGIYAIAAGVLVGVFAAISHFVFEGNVNNTFSLVSYLVEIVFVALLFPVVNLSVKAKFGDK